MRCRGMPPSACHSSLAPPY
uniref:Uncharacterized protein n=1 Tax=Rhizophora mucronata TaxID=61149 RepID=A0A2P2PMB8_RHIMU